MTPPFQLPSSTKIGTTSRGAALVLVLALNCILLLRNAWICDDAYITFRTIDNLVRGFGPVYNVGERVQAYTHPLWMLVEAAAYLLTREFFFTVIILSVVLSEAAVLVYASSSALSALDIALAAIPLLLSRSFIAFSTSGLETPLSYLLLAVFFACYLRHAGEPKTFRWLCFVAALAMLNRLDLMLLIAPAVGHAMWSTNLPRAKRLGVIALTFAPLWLWELFSLIYYGVPLPNTYYAKLAAGVPHRELLSQGIVYLLDALYKDPIIVLMVLVALGLSVMARDRKGSAMSLGVLLYISYVVWAGGDFMSGRFLVGPYLVACMVVAKNLVTYGAAEKGLAFAAMLVVVFSGGIPAWQPGDTPLDPGVDRTGFVAGSDRRVFHINRGNGLFGLDRHFDRPADPRVDAGRALKRGGDPVTVIGPAGMAGLYAGDGGHIVDMFGLCDPLLARLPYTNKDWTLSGHWERRPPYGYLETLRSWKSGSSTILLTDPELVTFYRHLSNIVRGPLFGVGRWRDIWNMNLGGYDGLIDRGLYQRYPSVRFVPQSDVPLQRSKVPLERGGVVIGKDGVVVYFGSTQRAQGVVVRIKGAGQYGVRVYSSSRRGWLEKEAELHIEGEKPVADGQEAFLSLAGLGGAFDRLHLYPKGGAGEAELQGIGTR